MCKIEIVVAMERETLLQSLDQIDLNLETLEEVLKPILENGLKGASQKLPIFERVKLNVTVVYAIDTLLFSRIRLVSHPWPR